MFCHKSNQSAAAGLVIGPYYIKIAQDEAADRPFMLPEAAEDFLDRNLTDDEPDFVYIISDEQIPYIKKKDYIESFYTGPMPYRIGRTSEGNYLWLRYNYRKKVSLAYIISRDWSRWKLIAENSGTFGQSSFWELFYIFAYSVLKKSGVMLHGVVMEWAGMGIIVSAHSGVGKSTHTNMWESKENALIINGDKALCYKENNVWYSCGSPWCGTSGKYINKRVPLKAIVLLERAENNYIVNISPLQGVMKLIELIFVPSWNEELITCALDSLDDLAAKVPLYKLYCRPDYEAVELLKKELGNLIETGENI